LATKEKVLAFLKAENAVLSGEALAQELGVSRTAIWKAIKELEKKRIPNPTLRQWVPVSSF
jgi:BirA family biotin operon repressor/biotin-[acetyl-CoA-carboxylase] ligase